jgi:hypothetical protein
VGRGQVRNWRGSGSNCRIVLSYFGDALSEKKTGTGYKYGDINMGIWMDMDGYGYGWGCSDANIICVYIARLVGCALCLVVILGMG